LRYIEDNYLPSGSGFNRGCVIALTNDTGLAYSKNSFIIRGDYQYMDEMGGYDGWFSFEIEISANLGYGYDMDFNLTSNHTSKSDDFIEDCYSDYILETMQFCIDAKIDPYQILDDYSQFQ